MILFVYLPISQQLDNQIEYLVNSYPCHKVSNDKKFNCIFCYCPLYMLKEDCGGNLEYTNGFKDCSDCKLPHSKNAHRHIMSKMDFVLAIGSERQILHTSS